MKLYTRFCMGLVFAVSNSISTNAFAHGNDDHEHSAPIANSASVAPRAAAQSEEFELVAVLQGKHLVIYLDRFDTNAAVGRAILEVESQGKWKAIAKETEPGVYVVDLAKGVMEATGKYPLTFSLQTEDSSDVLAASLEIAAEDEAHDHESTNQVWWKWLIAVSSSLGLIVAVLLFLRRRASATRSDEVGKLSGGTR